MKLLFFLVLVLSFLAIALSDHWRFLYCNGSCNIKGAFPDVWNNENSETCHNFNGTWNGFTFMSSITNLHGPGFGEVIFFLKENCQAASLKNRLSDNTCGAGRLVIYYYGAVFTYNTAGYGQGIDAMCFRDHEEIREKKEQQDENLIKEKVKQKEKDKEEGPLWKRRNRAQEARMEAEKGEDKEVRKCRGEMKERRRDGIR